MRGPRPDRHRQHDARDRCVDAGLVDEEPECDPNQEIRRQRSNTEPVEDDQHDRADARPYQGVPGDLPRVKEGDDEHGADIVHDGERRQEYL